MNDPYVCPELDKDVSKIRGTTSGVLDGTYRVKVDPGFIGDGGDFWIIVIVVDYKGNKFGIAVPIKINVRSGSSKIQGFSVKLHGCVSHDPILFLADFICRVIVLNSIRYQTNPKFVYDRWRWWICFAVSSPDYFSIDLFNAVFPAGFIDFMIRLGQEEWSCLLSIGGFSVVCGDRVCRVRFSEWPCFLNLPFLLTLVLVIVSRIRRVSGRIRSFCLNLLAGYWVGSLFIIMDTFSYVWEL